MINELVKQVKVLTDSEQVGQWEAPTFDVWVVRKDFADKHPAVAVSFATRVLAAQKSYLVEPEKWLKDQSNLSTLARLCIISAARVRGNIYLPVALQIT